MEIEIINKEREIQVILMHLQPGDEIPLHDHPDTHVFLYVVSGDIEMECFDKIRTDKGSLSIKSSFIKKFKASDSYLLTPTKNNLHHIKAITSASIMDIMTPGYYESGNVPNWYKIISTQDLEIKVALTEQPDYIVKAKEKALKRFEKKNFLY
ncbi:hypothetical protein CC99x_008675 [Candidatus Berkiella cookevillensis]|uniref:Cupin domain protein n=1 Tax=Candidatus Berkiella cookevillensis TaxID=437022 RepID=A0A0Q9YFK0_9GAMM|nr:hypothetical protein [Candidatus Berkiella cookevillensis]MCS5708974.1 hypothetical protein [Candidatus Berkiella cookevillensis]